MFRLYLYYFPFLNIRAFEISRDSFANLTDHDNVLINSSFSHLTSYFMIEGHHPTKYIGIWVEIGEKMGFLRSIVYMDLPLRGWRQVVVALVFIIYEL